MGPAILLAWVLAADAGQSHGFFTCNSGSRGPSLLGWCDRGDVYALVHLGSVAYARADGLARVGGQLAVVADANGGIHGLFQAGVSTRVTGRERLLLRVGLFNESRDAGDDVSTHFTLLSVGALNRGSAARAAGIELGVANERNDFQGLQLAPYQNFAAVSLRGVQLGLLSNVVGGEARGVQANLAAVVGWPVLLYRAAGDDFRPMRETWSIVATLLSIQNLSQDLQGAQLGGWVNETTGRLRGAQVGIVNLGGDVAGLQVGLFNRARRLKGLQLGLVNIVSGRTGGGRILPLVNVGLGGTP